MEFKIVAKPYRLTSGKDIDIKFFREYFGTKFRAFCMVDVRAKNGDMERFAFYRSSGTNPKTINGIEVQLGDWLPIYGIADNWIYKITTPSSIESYDKFIHKLASKLEKEFSKEMGNKRCLNKFPRNNIEEFNSIFVHKISDIKEEQLSIALINRDHKAKRYLELVDGDK